MNIRIIKLVGYSYTLNAAYQGDVDPNVIPHRVDWDRWAEATYFTSKVFVNI